MIDPETEQAAALVSIAGTRVIRLVAKDGSTVAFKPHGGGRFDV